MSAGQINTQTNTTISIFEIVPVPRPTPGTFIWAYSVESYLVIAIALLGFFAAGLCAVLYARHGKSYMMVVLVSTYAALAQLITVLFTLATITAPTPPTATFFRPQMLRYVEFLVTLASNGMGVSIFFWSYTLLAIVKGRNPERLYKQAYSFRIVAVIVPWMIMAGNIVLMTWGPEYQMWYEFLRDGFIWTTPISAIMIAISVFSLRASLVQPSETPGNNSAQRQQTVPSALLYRALVAFIAIAIFSPLYLIQRLLTTYFQLPKTIDQRWASYTNEQWVESFWVVAGIGIAVFGVFGTARVAYSPQISSTTPAYSSQISSTTPPVEDDKASGNLSNLSDASRPDEETGVEEVRTKGYYNFLA